MYHIHIYIYIHTLHLHYITLHFITLHYVSLHYITLHTYIHTLHTYTITHIHTNILYTFIEASKPTKSPIDLFDLWKHFLVSKKCHGRWGHFRTMCPIRRRNSAESLKLVSSSHVKMERMFASRSLDGRFEIVQYREAAGAQIGPWPD